MPVFWAMEAIRTMRSVGDAFRTLDMSAHADVSNGVVSQSTRVLSAFATLPFASGHFAFPLFRFGPWEEVICIEDVVPFGIISEADGLLVVANAYAH